MTETPTLSCPTHGAGLRAAYVCGHLAAGSAQGFRCAEDEPDALCPDAWCTACEAVQDAAGGWTDALCAAADIRLVCCVCYHGIRGRNAELPLLAVGTWAVAARAAGVEMQGRNDALDARTRFLQEPRFQLADETERLLFGDGAGWPVTARVCLLGSYSRNTGSWLWAWANRAWPATFTARAEAVRRAGEQHGFPMLADEGQTCERHAARPLAAVGAYVVGAVGLYRAPLDHLDVYLAILAMERAAAPEESAP